MWSERTIKSSLEMAEIENSTPHEADTWLLLPILEILNGNHKAKAVGFASQLSLLVDALEKSSEAQFLEDFVSGESNAENLRSSASVPPPTVVDCVLKELFHEGAEVVNLYESEHKSSQAIKGAPHRSLFAQFCLHSLWLGNCNIRAIAMLWIEFVREVRWCWEESQPLPKLPANGTIDLSSCLIHQKLQMRHYLGISFSSSLPCALKISLKKMQSSMMLRVMKMNFRVKMRHIFLADQATV